MMKERSCLCHGTELLAWSLNDYRTIDHREISHEPKIHLDQQRRLHVVFAKARQVMHARPAMDSTRNIHELKALTPHGTILEILVMPCDMRRNRKKIPQFFPRKTHAEAIDSHRLEREKRYMMIIHQHLPFFQILIPKIKSSRNGPSILPKNCQGLIYLEWHPNIILVSQEYIFAPSQ